MNLQVVGKKVLQAQKFSPVKLQPKVREMKVTQRQTKSIFIANKPPQKHINLSIRQTSENLNKKQTKIQKKQEKIEIKENNIPIITEKKVILNQIVEQQAIKKEENVLIGTVLVRYNHYKQNYQTRNKILNFSLIDNRYAFFDVFMGNYIPLLKIYRKNEYIEPLSTGKAAQYSWEVENETVYEIQIKEDEEAENQRERKIYKAPIQQKKCPLKPNARIQQINELLHAMNPQEYGGERHKKLLEERDLQDILYQ